MALPIECVSGTGKPPRWPWTTGFGNMLNYRTDWSNQWTPPI
jgi:hypothetical protein